MVAAQFLCSMPLSLTRLHLRAYSKWRGMITRCHSPKAHNYQYYGARGITVCERWRGRDGFAAFLADMGDPPEELTLGRIDNEKGYGPDNCKWQTWKEQAKDKRPGGQKRRRKDSIMSRARDAGIPYMLVYHRVRLGWTIEKALTTPKIQKAAPRPDRCRGLFAKAKAAGLNYTTVRHRIDMGWTEEAALSKPARWWKKPVVVQESAIVPKAPHNGA